MSELTTIKVPATLRDRVKAASCRGETQGDTIARALAALERERFWAQVATQVPDEEYLAEAATWERASLEDLEPRR